MYLVGNDNIIVIFFSFILIFLSSEGNPCSTYSEYRNFVMVVLPQLSSLDGVKIEISQRILAKQRWEQIAESILRDEEEYLIKREKEKQEV